MSLRAVVLVLDEAERVDRQTVRRLLEDGKYAVMAHPSALWSQDGKRLLGLISVPPDTQEVS